ncbi:MAG TPA: hypothetical protein VF128_15765 [Gemmatimonadaceae bacterium]
MAGITQHEVRRHPRWREELNTPLHNPSVPRTPGSRLLSFVGFLIVAVAFGVLLLQG